MADTNNIRIAAFDFESLPVALPFETPNPDALCVFVSTLTTETQLASGEWSLSSGTLSVSGTYAGSKIVAMYDPDFRVANQGFAPVAREEFSEFTDQVWEALKLTNYRLGQTQRTPLGFDAPVDLTSDPDQAAVVAAAAQVALDRVATESAADRAEAAATNNETLQDIGALSPADGALIIGDGSEFVSESGDTALRSLGGDTKGIEIFKRETEAQILEDLGIVPSNDADLTQAPNGIIRRSFLASLIQSRRAQVIETWTHSADVAQIDFAADLSEYDWIEFYARNITFSPSNGMGFRLKVGGVPRTGLTDYRYQLMSSTSDFNIEKEFMGCTIGSNSTLTSFSGRVGNLQSPTRKRYFGAGGSSGALSAFGDTNFSDPVTGIQFITTSSATFTGGSIELIGGKI